MSAVAEPLKQFVIPSAAELDAIVNGLYKAENPVQVIQLGLMHATGNVSEPLSEFAKPPTLGDVGALYLFARAVENCGDNIQEWGREIRRMLESLTDYIEYERERQRKADDA